MTCDVAVSFCVCVPFLGEKLFFSLSIFFPSNFQLPSLHLRTIEKKVAFLLPKVEFSPSNPTSKKIIAIEKVSQKTYFIDDFTSNHPIATQIPVFSNG